MVLILKELGTEKVLARIPCVNIDISRHAVRVDDQLVADLCEAGCEHFHSRVPGSEGRVCTLQVRPGDA